MNIVGHEELPTQIYAPRFLIQLQHTPQIDLKMILVIICWSAVQVAANAVTRGLNAMLSQKHT